MILKSIWQRVSSLKVGQKIGLGYTISLGVAVSGTITGFGIGYYYSGEAAKKEEHSRNEVQVLHRLQSRVLQIRTHQQQLIPLAGYPEKFQDEYAHLLKHEAEIREIWGELKDFSAKPHLSSLDYQEKIPSFIQNYDHVPTSYINELERRVARIRKLNQALPSDVVQAQMSLLEFTNSNLALEFDGISDDLQDLIDQAYQEQNFGEKLSEQANDIALKIVVVSIGISVLTAIIFAFLTSKMITKPIEVLTSVAKRATKDSNFELQATILQDDEIGALADAFNQLIRTVQQLLEEQQRTHLQMVQSEKMSALGKMVAGIAHEINNPVNFIHGNLTHLKEYSTNLLDFVHLYQKHYPNPVSEIRAQVEELDIEFLKADLPKILDSMKLGSERIRQIVLSLRNFSRLDEAELKAVDLHEGINSTLLILQHRLKERAGFPEIQVVCEFDVLPQVKCYPGPINQVFMNILTNAIDALEESNSKLTDQEIKENPSKIIIRTSIIDSKWVKIMISDNGTGMPESVRHCIFDPFFTTKAVGKGTGIGLSISYQIVTKKHGGKLECCSVLGEGTEFIIQIPVEHKDYDA